MKSLLCSALLLLAFAANAQTAAPLAHNGAPGEPHHHLKIENEYVHVYYVEVPPHEDTQLHQHDHDYLFLTLGDTEVINAILNKPEVKLSLKDGEVRFTRGNFAHVARNPGDKPFRNVTIELLKPQGEAENLCAKVIASAEANFCEKSTASGPGVSGFSVEPQFKTQEMNLDLLRLRPKTTSTSVAVPGKSLLVALDGSEVQVQVEGQPSKTLHGGEMIWIGGGSQGFVSNPGANPAACLQLSFDKSVGRANP